ncbi:MAG: hypothetical protein E6L02_02650 [Thaumarchaeota archaeon]|nr:MAG: hypothetical protein E6L02_02650 [Nitrososphaerota archaeon]
MTKMIHYNISKRFMMIFFVTFSIAMLFASNYFLKSASADHIIPRYEGEIVFPVSNEAVGNTNRTVSIMPTQNITAYDKTSPVEGFSNIVCKSGYQYVQMTGQYTAGNISYKVIFLRMTLLDNNGSIIAKGFGFVDDVDAHKTKTFNAITRYPSTFSSCTIQIDNAIPK